MAETRLLRGRIGPRDGTAVSRAETLHGKGSGVREVKEVDKDNLVMSAKPLMGVYFTAKKTGNFVHFPRAEANPLERKILLLNPETAVWTPEEHTPRW